MAYKIMIQGTMSSAGKSFLVTGLCRLFSNMGYRVAPFKSQNMALNSGVTFDGYEMGRAQIVQAEAARTIPDVRMNPILLKPNSDVGSQVIVMGKPMGNMKAREYYEYKPQLIPIIKEAFASLEKEYDVIIVEGAGSPAEINLKENDIVNMGLAKMLDIPVLLAGDIDLGGVFAQLLGTLEWLEPDEKDRIKGLIINKFRGDVSLLKPGIDMLESRTGKKVIGVVPYTRAQIDEEDSVTVDLSKAGCRINSKDLDKNSDNILHIAIIRLPHMSNFTDFTPLSLVPGVEVEYISRVYSKWEGNARNVDLSRTDKANCNVPFMSCVSNEDNDCEGYRDEYNDRDGYSDVHDGNCIPDMIIIPGTKSTISDLNWMKENGLADFVLSLKNKVPIMGICGGNQILGNTVSDPEGIEGDCESIGIGLGLLDQDTLLNAEKVLTKTEGHIHVEEGFFACLDGCRYEGYEIHSGVTDEAVSHGDVFGTYIHGIFDKAEVTKAIIGGLLDKKYEKYASTADKNKNEILKKNTMLEKNTMLDTIIDYSDRKDVEYENIAKLLEDALDINMLMTTMGILP